MEYEFKKLILLKTIIINTNNMSACSETSATSVNGSSASGSGSGSGTTSGLPPNPNNHLCTGNGVWYTPDGSDFTGYLHNPYGYKYLTKPMKDAVDLAKRNYPKIEKKLYDFLMYFFGNRQQNQLKGLIHQYTRLHNVVVNQNQAGLIIWGADGSHPDMEISEYTTKSGDTITLTVQSICYYLIKEFIKEDNLKKLCTLS